ncbi:hypothetical protein HBB16_00490 [Pseudonocardia sp. MCCB 268]|nr:hypothetical protein [Pseudonocardia cytotoxica]
MRLGRRGVPPGTRRPRRRRTRRDRGAGRAADPVTTSELDVTTSSCRVRLGPTEVVADHGGTWSSDNAGVAPSGTADAVAGRLPLDHGHQLRGVVYVDQGVLLHLEAAGEGPRRLSSISASPPSR